MIGAYRLLAALAFLGVSWALPIAARADDAPVDLHAPAAAPAPAAALAAKKPKPPKDAPKTAQPTISNAEAVDKAGAWLDDARVMTAEFVQIGPDGARSEGELHLARPGHMLFRYNPPQKLEIIADGRSVAVRDQKLGTQDEYFIAQTPLKFLLADHIDLAKDTKIKRVQVDDKAITIEIEDKATFGGTAEIALSFDPVTFALQQWTVIDAQGFQTVVTLFDVDLVTKPDPALFHIDENTGVPQGGLKR